MSGRVRTHLTQLANSVLAVLLVGLNISAGAQQKNMPACPQRAIVVGLYEFGYFYHAGNGLDKDIADQLALRSGCKFEYRVMPRGLIWQELQGGGVDMTLSGAATSERAMFSWATPYVWVKNMVIVSKSVDPNVRSTTDFIAAPYLRFGIARSFFPGTAYSGFIEQLRNIGRVDEIDDNERLFAMFKAGRFNAILGTQMVYTNYFKNGQFRIEDWAPNGPRDSANLLISKKNFSQDEAKRWGDLMKAMISDGSLRSMLEKYVAAEDATKMLAP